MDFSIFDRQEHMTALAWLGKKPWLLYKDYPEQRSISASPKKIYFKPSKAVPEGSLIVSEKEMNRHSDEMWKILREIISVLEFDIIGTLWYDTLAKALAGGPKIFRPTPEQCEALQHAEARYSFADYRQPFPVIILEIPQGYKEILKTKYNISNSPQYVLVNHDEKNRFVTVSAFYNHSNIITHITPDRTEYKTIENSLTQNRDRRRDNIEKPSSESEKEFEAAENVQRLGINFAMMMSLYSVKVAGPLDPSNYKRWEQESNNRRRGGDFTTRAKEAQAKLVSAMHLIQFNQQVSFYDEIEENIEVAQSVDIEKLHKSPRSHWRRGHFVMQACGVGHKDRKMIFRKPVLVRAKYFLGNIKDAAVTYTMHPGRGIPTAPVPQEQLTNTQIPESESESESEPNLKPGQKIEVISVEDSPVIPGTTGKILKVLELGSGITQILAEAEDHRFILLSPPDVFKLV